MLSLNEKPNLLDTIMPMSPRKSNEVVDMLREIETIQAGLLGHARRYWEDEDMRFLLQTEYNNLHSCKQAIMWMAGWADELINQRALVAYEKDKESSE